MSTWTYDESLRRLLAHEGGYSNHPSDPGGPTNFGITIHDYRKYIDAGATAADVRRMTVGQAKAIYQSKYWNAMRCDSLPAGVDYAVFDYGVNSGIGRAPKVLKRLVGLDASNSVVTPELIAAVRRCDANAVVNTICDERLRFLKSLRTWPVFGKGWGRRVEEVRTAALAMADRKTPATEPTATTVGHGSVPEPRTIKEAIRTGVPVVGGGWLVAAFNWVSAHPVETGLIVLAVGMAVYVGLSRLKAWRSGRQEAPMPGTPVLPQEGTTK